MTTREKIAHVNATLAEGEPSNISIDPKGRAGYHPQPIIDAMNASFEIGEWGFDEIAPPVKVSETEKSITFVASVRVWLTDTGEKLPFQPSAWGEGTQPKHAPGDAMKSAQTDAIKKALSYFSIGNRAYLLPSKPKPQRPNTPTAQRQAEKPVASGTNGRASVTQTSAIASLIRMKGLKLDATETEFGKLDEMTGERATQVIAHLSNLPTPSTN